MASHRSRRRMQVTVWLLLTTALAVSAGDAASQPQSSPRQRIEITIQDKTFFLQKSVPIQVGQTIELIVRNQDPVRHGIASTSLLGLLVSGADDEIMTTGRGWKGST